MKTTVVLRLQTTQEHLQALRATQLAYHEAWDCVSRHAYQQAMSAIGRLHEDTYTDLRQRFRLPPSMARRIPREVSAIYKALAKVKKKAQVQNNEFTTLMYHSQEYRFEQGAQVSLLTLDGRVSIPYTGYAPHITLLCHSSLGAALLRYDKSKNIFDLLVSFEVEAPDSIS